MRQRFAAMTDNDAAVFFFFKQLYFIINKVMDIQEEGGGWGGELDPHLTFTMAELSSTSKKNDRRTTSSWTDFFFLLYISNPASVFNIFPFVYDVTAEITNVSRKKSST